MRKMSIKISEFWIKFREKMNGSDNVSWFVKIEGTILQFLRRNLVSLKKETIKKVKRDKKRDKKKN